MHILKIRKILYLTHLIVSEVGLQSTFDPCITGSILINENNFEKVQQ